MFILFAGQNYYPSGGADDLIGKYETLELCQSKYKELKTKGEYGWGNIIDVDSMIVYCMWDGKENQEDWKVRA